MTEERRDEHERRPEEAQDILREHSFDGIQEYDNRLPMWWQVTFYLTVLYAVIYVAYYHAGPGKLGPERWKAEQIAFLEAQAAAGGGVPSEDLLRGYLGDSARVQAGEALYQDPTTKCISCHGPDALGQIGPNLRDDQWKHGSDLSDIIASIEKGFPQQGMPARGGASLDQTQVIDLALYIAHLNKTRKANGQGKHVEGEIEDPIDY